MKKNTIVLFFILILSSSTVCAQKNSLNWISFEQLEDSLKIKPKKVFIIFHASWCSYCKKMEKVAFKNDEIINILNKDYYSIKMNAESKQIITFEGITYQNNQIGKSRKPTHQIPLLLASRPKKSFSLPATIILNQDFKIEKRFFEYLSPKKLSIILK